MKYAVILCSLLVLLGFVGCDEKLTMAPEESAVDEAVTFQGEDKEQNTMLYDGEYLLPPGVAKEQVYQIHLPEAEVHYEFDLYYPASKEFVDVILRAKVKAMGEESFGKNWLYPNTSYTVEVQEVYKGEAPREKEVKISLEGAFITIKDYLDLTEENHRRWLKLDNAFEKRGMFLGIFPYNYEQILPEKEYIFFLMKTSDEGEELTGDEYYVMGEGHGVFHYDAEKQEFYNEIHQGRIKVEDLKK